METARVSLSLPRQKRRLAAADVRQALLDRLPMHLRTLPGANTGERRNGPSASFELRMENHVSRTTCTDVYLRLYSS